MLSNGIIIFLLVAIDFSISMNLISHILLLYWLYLSFVHVIKNCQFLFDKINIHLRNLFRCSYIFLNSKLLSHFQDTYVSNMIIFIEIFICCIYFFIFILDETNTSAYDMIISVLVKFNGLLSNFFDSFYQTIMVSIWIIINNSHPSINFSHLFPVRHFTRAIHLNGFELIRVSIFSFQFITPVFIKVSNLFNLNFLKILYKTK